MSVRSVVLPILVVVLLIVALVAAACGSSAQDKADLSAALDKIETSMAKFQQMGADSTVADVKAARDEIAPLWADVVEAAKKVEGADATAAEKAWNDLDAAVSGIPDDANIMQAATAIMGPLQALVTIENEFKSLVSPEQK